jgi:hypothetical protein
MKGDHEADMSTKGNSETGVVNHAIDRGFSILLLLLVTLLLLSTIIEPVQENSFVVVLGPLTVFVIYVFFSIIFNLIMR